MIVVHTSCLQLCLSEPQEDIGFDKLWNYINYTPLPVGSKERL